ncbi:MAG: hypothetical protein RIG77_08875 [Cyclobacteriaceae bacterium]
MKKVASLFILSLACFGCSKQDPEPIILDVIRIYIMDKDTGENLLGYDGQPIQPMDVKIFASNDGVNRISVQGNFSSIVDTDQEYHILISHYNFYTYIDYIIDTGMGEEDTVTITNENKKSIFQFLVNGTLKSTLTLEEWDFPTLIIEK